MGVILLPSQLARKVAPSLQRELGRTPNNFVPIIVDVKPQETGFILDRISRRFSLPIRMKSFLKDLNLSFISTIGHMDLINRLKKLDEVNYISFDREMRSLDFPNFPIVNEFLSRRKTATKIMRERFEPTEFIYKEGAIPSGEIADALGYQEAQDDGITGKGVRVAVCGTGFMKNRQLRTVETYSTAVEMAGDQDTSGHETFTITEIAGKELEIGNGLILKGLAPGVDIISVRCLFSPFGTGRTSACIDGIRIGIERGKADIVSNSLGSDTPTSDFENDPYAKTIKGYEKLGKVILFASGNNGMAGPGSIGSPADVEETIAVGSCSYLEWKKYNEVRRSYFSSYGPTTDGRIKVDCVSFGGGRSQEGVEPMETIISSSSGMIDLSDFIKNMLANISGTSMSTPYVSALIALWFELYKNDVGDKLNTSKVKSVFEKVGIEKTNELGWGLISYDWLKRYET